MDICARRILPSRGMGHVDTTRKECIKAIFVNIQLNDGFGDSAKAVNRETRRDWGGVPVGVIYSPSVACRGLGSL